MVDWRALTEEVEHRPWPLPRRPWMMTMSWPWPLYEAEVEIAANTVAEAHGFELEGAPELAHYARQIDVVAWWPGGC